MLPLMRARVRNFWRDRFQSTDLTRFLTGIIQHHQHVCHSPLWQPHDAALLSYLTVSCPWKVLRGHYSTRLTHWVARLCDVLRTKGSERVRFTIAKP